jgi:hypothetical protein
MLASLALWTQKDPDFAASNFTNAEFKGQTVEECCGFFTGRTNVLRIDMQLC